MFSSEWSAALSSLLPQYSYISTSVAQSAVNKIHRHQQMSQPAEVTERGFCLFVICHSGDTSLKSPPASNLDYFCCAPGDLQRKFATFTNILKQPSLPSASRSTLVFAAASLFGNRKGFLVVRQKKPHKTTTTTNPGPGIWGLMLPSAECHLFPLAPSRRGAAPELTGWGPGAAEPDGAGQLSRRCNTASWECSQFTRPCLWLADRLHLTCRPAAKRFSELSENSKCPRSWERCPGCIWDFYTLYFLLNLGRESLVTCAGRWWRTEHCSVLCHADATDAGLKKIPQTRSHFSVRFCLAEGSTEMNGGVGAQSSRSRVGRWLSCLLVGGEKQKSREMNKKTETQALGHHLGGVLGFLLIS